MRNSQKKLAKPNQLLVNTLIRIFIFLLLIAYCVVSIVVISLENRAECKRLEKNYVICEQYKTSFGLMKSIFERKYVSQNRLNESKITYRLEGTLIRNNNLYLKTDRQPILYITKVDEWAMEYPINRIEQFIKGQGESKLVLYLENSLTSFSLYLTSCLIVGAFIIRFVYYLHQKQII